MLGLLAITFAAGIACCWAWDSRALHKRLDDLEAQLRVAKVGQ